MMSECRCAWVSDDPLYIAYHDQEWGVPSRDDRHLFEMLTLEGAQAGLSWITVLRKREGYRKAFHRFDPTAVARMAEPDVERLMHDAGLIRNRLKIASALSNARAFVAIQAEFGVFANYLWGFVGGRPIQNRWASIKEAPAKTALSDRISKDLQKRGFRFVGSTIIYAYLQAVGLVNDHTLDCFRHAQVLTLGAAQ